MKKYKLNEDFGGMKSGDVIETDGELGDVFPAGSFELIEEAGLEVATPGDDNEESDEDDDAPHTENLHGGPIPSHYMPVNERGTTEQLKPKRGRPAKTAE